MPRPARNATSSLGANQPNRFAGKFAYRFSGFAMPLPDLIPHYLVGVGLMELGPDRTITGTQNASITPLQVAKGADARVPGKLQERSAYKITGTYKEDGELSGKATIKFTMTEPPDADGGQDSVGEFRFVVAGNYDRLWMISTGSTLDAVIPITVDEVVSIEAVRIT